MQAKRFLTGVVAVAVVLTGCATGTTVSGSGDPASTASPPTAPSHRPPPYPNPAE